jgi:DNA phosphorothioation-dependent restriction protein DptH
LNKLQEGLSPIAVPVGPEVNTRKDVYWDPDPEYGNANPHLMIIGESGFGKTYAIQCLIAELAQRGVPSVVIDYGQGFDLKSSPKEFVQATHPTEILAGEHGININPLQIHVNDINGPVNVAVRVSDSFSRIYGIGVQQHAVLRDVILEVFEERKIYKTDKVSWGRPAPYLSEVQDKLEVIAADRQHGKSKIALSLKSHISTFFIFNTFRASGTALDWDSILVEKNKVLIIQLRGLEGRTQQVVTEFLLWDLYYYMMRTGPSQLRLFCVLDEAHNLSFDKGTPVDKLVREARKFGVGLILSSQQPADFTELAFSNTASKLVFQTSDVNRHVSSKLVNKSENILNAKSLATEISRLPRGRAFFITRNLGALIDVSSFSERSYVNSK